jgi:hypothetical protein
MATDLRSLMPTRMEELKLSKYRKDPGTDSVLFARSERFMLELCGISDARKKVEALVFRLEFSKIADALCSGESGFKASNSALQL